MSTITRILLTVACFFAAIACYTFGIPAGGVVFILLGVLFEGLFWFGLFRRPKKSK